MKETIYISGPMTGIKDDNKQEFIKAEAILIQDGFIVISPHRIEKIKGYTWHNYMRLAIKKMMLADRIYMLKGWKFSRGARIEHNLAAELGFKLMYQEN